MSDKESGGATVVRMSDSLLNPKKYVAEIHNFPNGMAEFAVQFVGKEKHEGWMPAASEAEAREKIKAILAEAGIEMEPEEDEEPLPEQPGDQRKDAAATLPEQNGPREIESHKVGVGMDEAIRILVNDDPGPGGACHSYSIVVPQKEKDSLVTDIQFQKGAVAEAGPNGISVESLLAVCIDRLEGFQSGPYPCEENAAALDHLQRGLKNLQKRTIERAARNAEGRSKA